MMYLFFILIALEAYDEILKYGICLNKVVSVCCIFLLVFLSNIYLVNYKTNNERIMYLEEKLKQNEKVIEMVRLPYEDYVWDSNYDTKTGNSKIKFYYEIPEDVTFKSVSKKKWNKLIKEMENEK